MTAYKPLPYEIKKPIISFLRKTGQTIAYAGSPYLIPGRLNVEDVDRAWCAGAVTVDDAGDIAICGISVRARVDATKLRNRLIEYLWKAQPSEIVNAASFLGVGL